MNDKEKTSKAVRQARTIARDNLWLEHMRETCSSTGIWWSSKRSRTGLPEALHLSDIARIKALDRLVIDGRLERVGRGKYRVVEVKPC